MTSQMEPNGTSSVQYDRWNEDNINMNVEGSQSTMMRWDELTADNIFRRYWQENTEL